MPPAPLQKAHDVPTSKEVAQFRVPLAQLPSGVRRKAGPLSILPEIRRGCGERSLSMKRVRTWLESLGLNQYADNTEDVHARRSR
jgi:hypothetical protein